MPKPPKASKSRLWRAHKERWSNCEACPLCERRRKVVLYRGQIPCDVLFVGEAPGGSEDALGKPFIGPAGKFLDEMIANSLPDCCRIGFTNIVACVPKSEDGAKIHDPPELSARECAGRLKEMYSICEPSLVVLVGKTAAKYVDYSISVDKTNMIEIIHPAAIMRMDVSQQGLAIQRTEVALQQAYEDHVVPF